MVLTHEGLFYFFNVFLFLLAWILEKSFITFVKGFTFGVWSCYIARGITREGDMYFEGTACQAKKGEINKVLNLKFTMFISCSKHESPLLKKFVIENLTLTTVFSQCDSSGSL